MYTHRDRLLFLIMISMIVYFCSQAQDISSDRTSLKEGAWALQFGIASNFTLTSFQGTSIAAKYQLSDKNAIRGGVTINGTTTNGNSSIAGSVADTSYGTVPGNTTSNAANVAFILQYLWYMNPSGPVHFYVGFGPSLSYSHSQSSSDNSNLYSSSSGQGYIYRTVFSSSSTQWAIAGVGVAGVEWFACQWLSIRAEYTEGIQYQWRSTTSSNDYSYIHNYNNYAPHHDDNSGTTKGWALNSSGVSFGLSVYW